MNDLVAFEHQLAPLAPRFEEVLGKAMPVSRLIRTVLVSVERLPKLLECDRQSLFNAAMSAACLGLEVDGVTGQAFLIPFKNRAQLVVGYRGYNTLAARSGFTIRAGVVREGDEFVYDLASAACVHSPKLGNKGRIVAAWALAVSNKLPSVLSVLGIDDLLAVKAKSPGAKREDSPWNDPAIGFPAMCEKTPKRRLARAMPLNTFQLAARMEEAFEEQGAASFITPERGLVIEGDAATVNPTPTVSQLLSPRPYCQPGVAAGTAAPSPSAEQASGAADEPSLDEAMLADRLLAQAAELGTAELVSAWNKIPRTHQAALKAALDRRHKPRAREVDTTLENANG